MYMCRLTSSPAISNIGIRFGVRVTAKTWIEEDDLLDPLHLNAIRTQDPIEGTLAGGFYVDDLLTSQPTEEDALNLIQTAIYRIEIRYKFM